MQIRAQQIKATFWGVDLLLTAVTVFFLVKVIQSLFFFPAVKPQPLSDPSLPNSTAVRPKIKSYEQYAAVKNSNLFGALASSNVSAKGADEKLPETTLELELLGCVAAYDPQLSFAIIRDKKGRNENTYGIGDVIVGDAKVEEVRESEVVISRGGRREVLAMTFTEETPLKGPSFPPADAMRATLPPGPSASDTAIRVVNENLRYVNKAKLLEEAGSNIGQLISQFKTSPNTVDGKPAGVRLDQLGSGGLVDQSGLQPGDIVKSVNGIRVNSTDDLLSQGDRLQNSPEIRVVVERDGRHRTLVYKVR